MLQSRIIVMLGMFVLISAVTAPSVMGAILAIDEDFDGSSFFADLNWSEPTTEPLTTAQGVNVTANAAIFNPNYNGCDAPIAYVDSATIGAQEEIDATHKCYRLNSGQSLQMGTIDGTTYVNGGFGSWGDSCVINQAALAVPTGALSEPDGSVVGKWEIAYDGRGLEDPADLRLKTYELRVDSANSEVDIYSIDSVGGTPDAAVKAYDGLDGTGWANITCTIWPRCPADPLGHQWGVPDRGPTTGTEMNPVVDFATAHTFVNSNAAVTAAEYTYPSEIDGRKSTPIDGYNYARVLGVKFTSGASTDLFVDNIYIGAGAYNPAHVYPNIKGRVNVFTAPAQGVPGGEGPQAGVKTWDLY